MTTGRPTATSRGSAAFAHLTLDMAPAQVTCVTADEDLLAAIRLAVPGASIVAVATPAALAEILLAGSCAVLAVDVPELGPAASAVTGHLARQFPDVPIIAIGDRHEEAALAPLISAGAVYRFLHRPVSAARARTFIEAALRRHEELRAAASPRPAPVAPAAPAPAPFTAQSPEPMALEETSAPPHAQLEPWTGPRTGMTLAAGIAAFAIAVLAVVLAARFGHDSPAPARPPEAALAPARPTPPAAVPTPAPSAATRSPATIPAPVPVPAAVSAPSPAAGAAPTPVVPRTTPENAAAAAAPPSPIAAPAPAPTATTGTAPTPSAPAAATAPPAAPPAAGRALVRLVAVEPEYPEGARDVGLEGWVDVHFTVDTAGEPEDITVTGADPTEVFEAAAIEAVRHWRYEPPAVATPVDQRIPFKLH